MPQLLFYVYFDNLFSSLQGTYYNLTRADCDNLFHTDMVKTCDNKYSTSWLNVLKNSFGEGKYEVNQKEMCVLKAGHFKEAVEMAGEERFTGEESWCQDPCIIQYLLGKIRS